MTLKRIVDNNVKPGKSALAEQIDRVAWRKLIIAFVAFIALTFILALLMQKYLDGLNLPPGITWLSYAVVFGVSVITNLSLIIPVPFALNTMGAAVQLGGSPVLIALAGALGGSLGELSGYYAGLLNKKLAIPEDNTVYQAVERWVNRWGFWAILLLALQPIFPFDIGGFIAGAARMPMRKFFPALALGKFVKYLVVVACFPWLYQMLPFLSR